MLDRFTRATALALLLLFTLPALASAATVSEKVAAAKRVDRDGYRPALVKSAAALLSEVEPNDQPADANTVGVGDVVQASFGVSGDEDWFEVTADAAGYLALSTSAGASGPTDTVLEVYDATGADRLAFDDDGGLGLFSALPHFPVESSQVVLVRVRHYSDQATDDYELNVEVGTAPPPVPTNDSPGQASDIECNKTTVGSNDGASDQVPVLDCLPLESAGGDLFYRVVLPYSNQLNVQVTPGSTALDPAVYLFTDPADPLGSCLVGADDAFAGEPEVTVYTNEEFEDGLTVYIGVDSWAPASAGDYVLEVDCGFVVPNETSNWSALKANW